MTPGMQAIEAYKSTRKTLFDEKGIQPESKFVSTQGPVKKVHYIQLGNGEPLILLHGGGSHTSEWLNILKPLSEHYQLYVVDRPGCGLSENFNYREVNLRKHAVDFIYSFMDALGLEKANFLGHSMGGYFSICFSMRFPEKVEKLVLIGAPAGMNHYIPFMLRLLGTKGLNSLLMKTVAKPSFQNVLNIYNKILVADASKLSDDFIMHTLHNQLIPGRVESFTTLLENVLTLKGWKRKYYIGDKLGELNIPVRFIWGEKDAFEKPATGIEKANSIKNHQFEVVENAGHCAWIDNPAKCVSLIISMLKEEYQPTANICK